MRCTKNWANKTKKIEMLQTGFFHDWSTSNRSMEISNNKKIILFEEKWTKCRGASFLFAKL